MKAYISWETLKQLDKTLDCDPYTSLRAFLAGSGIGVGKKAGASELNERQLRLLVATTRDMASSEMKKTPSWMDIPEYSDEAVLALDMNYLNDLGFLFLDQMPDYSHIATQISSSSSAATSTMAEVEAEGQLGFNSRIKKQKCEKDNKEEQEQASQLTAILGDSARIHQELALIWMKLQEMQDRSEQLTDELIQTSNQAIRFTAQLIRYISSKFPQLSSQAIQEFFPQSSAPSINGLFGHSRSLRSTRISPGRQTAEEQIEEGIKRAMEPGRF